MTPEYESLPPVQYLIMETLAARARLGERYWTFPTPLRPALNALQDRGLITWRPAPTPDLQAYLTDAGRSLALFEGYSYAPVTEYGQQYSSGGYLTMVDSPEIEAIYPLADRVRDGMRNGGHVGRRRIVIVEDWEQVTEAPEGAGL